MCACIEEFRLSTNPWRIDWLGHLTYSGLSHSEPKIAVYLSELRPDFTKALANDSLLKPYSRKVVHIKVGQIALLRIGSVWIDGQVIPSRIPEQHRTCTVEHGQFKVVRFDEKITLDAESIYITSEQQYRLGDQVRQTVGSTWLAIVSEPLPGTRFIAIPATALFQKCLATSPKAVRRLVYGQIDKIIDPNGKFVDGEESTYYINLFKDFRDSEGKALANLKADEVAKKEFKQFRNTLVIDSANQ